MFDSKLNLLLFLSFALGPSQIQIAAFQFGFVRHAVRKEVDVHKIVNPRYDFFDGIDDDGVDISEVYAFKNTFDNGSMLYLATWANETTVIGMMEVQPDVEYALYLDDVYITVPIRSVFLGLHIDEVTTTKRHQRKGIAKTLFHAIERDAHELVERMKRSGGIYSGPLDKRIRISLCSVNTKAALGFYRSVGFQFQPWKDESSRKRVGFLRRIGRRLKWTWRWLTPRTMGLAKLIKLVDNEDSDQCAEENRVFFDDLS